MLIQQKLKKLKAIYALLEDDITTDEDHKHEFDRRYNDYQLGIGKTLLWEETVALSDKALADRKKQ